MHSRLWYVSVAALCVMMLLSGCASSREMFMQGGHGFQPGIERAAFELDCPKENLETVELGSFEFGVRGCGKSATYRFNRHGGGWYRVERLDDQRPDAAR